MPTSLPPSSISARGRTLSGCEFIRLPTGMAGLQGSGPIALAIRYGLPPFVRLRPRPDGGYGAAGAKAMQGDWKSTAVVFRRLLVDFLEEV